MEGGPGATCFFQKGLKKAIEEGRIEILFQPKVEIASGRIVGAEALARWQQPDKAEIGPETLFEAAAQAELSVELSGYVHTRAVEAALDWPRTLSHLRLAVNITAADTASPAFAAQLLAMLDETGFDPAGSPWRS
jgi:EAL domain-containing protein (putative c-di-GMP-specific phosphodiesterase class I)